MNVIFRDENEPIELNSLDTIDHNIENQELIDCMERKIEELGERIEQNLKTTTYDLVQRAALQRKVCYHFFCTFYDI